MEAEDPVQADRLRRSYAAMTRTMPDLMRQLERHQQRPVASAPPPPAIEPIPPPRRRLPEPKPPQVPPHRENARTGRVAADPREKDPATMTDQELRAAMTEIGALCAAALERFPISLTRLPLPRPRDFL